MPEIPVIRVCPECGSAIEEGYDFCIACGRMCDKVPEQTSQNTGGFNIFETARPDPQTVRKMNRMFSESRNRMNIIYLAIWVIFGTIGSGLYMFSGDMYTAYLGLNMTPDQIVTVAWFYLISAAFTLVSMVLCIKRKYRQAAVMFCVMAAITAAVTLTCGNTSGAYLGVLGGLVAVRIYTNKLVFEE